MYLPIYRLLAKFQAYHFTTELLDLNTVRGEKRILEASQDLEQFLRKVYSACKACESNKEIRQIHMLSVIWRELCHLLNLHPTQHRDLW